MQAAKAACALRCPRFDVPGIRSEGLNGPVIRCQPVRQVVEAEREIDYRISRSKNKESGDNGD
jgi:hypothetical protein